MKEYDPKSDTYKNAEIDSETKEIRYGETNPEEDEIIYKPRRFHLKKIHLSWWNWCILAAIVVIPWMIVLILHLTKENIEPEQVETIVKETIKEVKEEVIINTNVLTVQDSSSVGDAYTEIIDTTFDGYQMHLYQVHYGIPELHVCNGTPIDTTDTNIVFAARAADLEKGTKRIIGDFIVKGNILSEGSIRKEGFCAIIDNNITLGVERSTPFEDQAVKGNGYFFRNAPLIYNKVRCLYEGEYNQASTRRALCSYNSNIVFIEVESITMTEFIDLLSDFGVKSAIYMVGSKEGHGFCRDKEGKLRQWGVCRAWKNDFKNINYLIWKAK